MREFPSSSDTTEVIDDQISDEDDANEQYDRGQVEAAEIGHETPDRPEQRLSEPVEHKVDLSNEGIVDVHDVESQEPRHDHHGDDHPPIDIEDEQNKNDEGIHREGRA
jgi:hypothetical protein